jgi:hypothetical protein
MAGGLAAVIPAALAMALRSQLEQKNALVVTLAWLLAQAAQLSVGWGRNARLFALADLSRAAAAWELAPLSKGQGPAI